MRLYLAGPMSGYAEFNHPAFTAAADVLRDAGYEVFSPAEHDAAVGLDVTGMTGEEVVDRRALLGADLAWICANADGLALLDDWERSKGALAEVATARALGIKSAHIEWWLKDA